MFPYVYKVKWWDDTETVTSFGMTFAYNYSEAVCRLSNYFDETAIQEIEIKAIGEGTEYILELKEETIKKLLDECRQPVQKSPEPGALEAFDFYKKILYNIYRK